MYIIRNREKIRLREVLLASCFLSTCMTAFNILFPISPVVSEYKYEMSILIYLSIVGTSLAHYYLKSSRRELSHEKFASKTDIRPFLIFGATGLAISIFAPFYVGVFAVGVIVASLMILVGGIPYRREKWIDFNNIESWSDDDLVNARSILENKNTTTSRTQLSYIRDESERRKIALKNLSKN